MNILIGVQWPQDRRGFGTCTRCIELCADEAQNKYPCSFDVCNNPMDTRASSYLYRKSKPTAMNNACGVVLVCAGNEFMRRSGSACWQHATDTLAPLPICGGVEGGRQVRAKVIGSSGGRGAAMVENLTLLAGGSQTDMIAQVYRTPNF